MSDRHDIAFCVNDAYTPYIGVTISSILANNRSGHIDFHVLTDDISPGNVERLRAITGPYDATINFYHVDAERLKTLKLGRFTVYAWLRVLLPDVLPADIHRVLYLDSDIVVCDDLGELYNRDLDGVSLAAVTDYPAHDPEVYKHCDLESDGKYVCSGVLLINLDYWRQHGIGQRIIDWATRHGDIIEFPDQDAINHVCHDTLDLLPLRYGIQGAMLVFEHYYQHDLDGVRQCIERPAIIHYNSCSPWYYECLHPLVYIWDDYNKALGCYKAPLKYRSPMTAMDKLKSRIWHMLHKTDRHDVKRSTMESLMRKYGLKHV